MRHGYDNAHQAFQFMYIAVKEMKARTGREQAKTELDGKIWLILSGLS